MQSYTTLLQTQLDDISPDDENFIDELLEVSKLFRTFSEGLDDFIVHHGYEGDLKDTDGKLVFIRNAFKTAQIEVPRELAKWYTELQPIRRETAFQICFAFGLDGPETDEFFRRVFARERSLDCHVIKEAVYYFCLNNELSYAEAQDILRQFPEPPAGLREGQPVVYTSSIIRELNDIDDREGLIHYITGHIDQFGYNNVKSYESIRQMWSEIASVDGLVAREFQSFYSGGDDAATDVVRKALHKAKDRKDVFASNYEIYLAIFQLDKKRVQALNTDRNLIPVLRLLHTDVQDSFPERQVIAKILRGDRVSYESIRKWLILLRFYTFWVRKRLSTGSCIAGENDSIRCIDEINATLVGSGYSELYVGNPYDWLFLYVSKDQEPLITFRTIWSSLLERVLQDAPANPKQ